MPLTTPVGNTWSLLVLPSALILALAAAALPAAQPDRRVALTFDDLPGVSRAGTLEDFQRMNGQILDALVRHHTPAIGFVNEGKLEVPGERDARVRLLDDWLEAGMALGNHTYGHRGLTNTPAEEFERDVLRGEAVTRRLVEARKGRLEFFRHPMTQTGPTLATRDRVEKFLATHGYRVAPFTIEDSDYMFALIYDDAVGREDIEGVERIRDAYLAHQARMVEWFEQLSRETFGREIAQVLLIHVNRLNGDVLPEAIEAMTRGGYRFVPLETALSDPAYLTPDGYVGRFGPSWLHRWRVALGLSNRLRDEPEPPEWVVEAYQRLQ